MGPGFRRDELFWVGWISMKATMTAGLLLLGGMCSREAIAQEAASPLAPDEPLWELRVGATGLYGPAYPGSSENTWNGVGAPLVIYRGDRIRFGEYGVARAIAAETPKLELDVSLDAVYSAEDVKSRAGMPDLDYLFQIGPQVVWHVADTGWTPKGRTELTAFLPVRGVGASDFKSLEHAGWLAEPSIMFRRQYQGELRTSWNVQLFASFADQDLMDYWYGVAPQYATPARPAYVAEAGYLATGLKASWTRELTDNFQIFLTYQGRSFSGAANERSPLLEEDVTHAFSISFVWKALKSKRRAKNDDM
jgi:MipA family protein